MGESLDQRSGTLGPPEAPVDPPPPPALATWPPRPARVVRAVNRPAPAAGRRAIAISVVLAIAFALPVTFSLQQPPDPWKAAQITWTPVDTAPLLAIVAVASLLSALAGASLGTVVARRKVVVGTLVALLVGWTIAVSLVPALAVAFGLRFAAAPYCIDGCLLGMEAGDPAAGLSAVIWPPLFGLITVLPVGCALVASLVAVLLSRAGRPFAAAVVAALAWTFLNFFGMAMGEGLVPFLLQVVGVLAWAAVLWEPWRRRGAPDVTSV